LAILQCEGLSRPERSFSKNSSLLKNPQALQSLGEIQFLFSPHKDLPEASQSPDR
jgi:hypothetical protein